jgi:hypothetical protein
MSKKTLLRKYPLNCPFCDEEAFPEEGTHRVVTPFRIYTMRKCSMGHRFYSVEEIPEDQSAIHDEVQEIRRNRRNGTA